MSKTETSDILNQISKKWNRNLPKIKNIKVHYVDDNAQILVGVNFKILRLEDEFIPFLSESELLESFPNVTVDIHRIFRLEGTLNSKSGLCMLVCKDIEKFRPYSEACLIDDKPTEIIANCPLKFQLKNKKFGPYNSEKTTVPKYAAVYMMCKGIANSA